jgi:hypothetical protein
MFDHLDPQTRAMLPPELAAALKKYGTWSKIPKAERARLLAKLTGTAAAALNAGHDVNAALAGQRPAKPGSTQTAPGSTAASTAPVAPANLPPGLDAGGWVVSRRFKPSGYDTKRLSVEKYLPFALAEAKKLVPDAILFRIDSDGVYPDGHADITLAEHGSLDFRFISPKRAKGDTTRPVGAKQDYKCMFRIMFDDDGGWSAPIDGWECKEPLLGPPKCTTQQIWKKALAQGAPPNAVAEIGYRGWDNKARWYFDIKGTKFSEMYDDDCR